MDDAAAAMEKVPLNLQLTPEASADLGSPPARSTIPFNPNTAPPPLPPASMMDRFMHRVNSFFSRICHSLGALFLRILSTLMLLLGILGGVLVQFLAYYYTGVLNPWVFIACALYAPTLISVALIREEMVQHGTGTSGAGPPMSQFVTLAYLVMCVSGFASTCLPLSVASDHRISGRSFWTAIGANALFYYCMLISEVLFAAALNVTRAKARDEEERRREKEDPAWMTSYRAIAASDRAAGDDA